jgi:nucleotide-binding universal stress UspA family protein
VIILAALDDSAAARPVLETARRVAALLGARVEAVHVRGTGTGTGTGGAAAAIADAAHLPLHVRGGDVLSELRSEVRQRDALALVIGAREGPPGAACAGHVALDVVQSFGGTIVVVPPDAADRPLRRVLVAVEGDGESAGLRRLFDHLGSRPLPEVIALHVIEPLDVPPFADSPIHETNAFEREFRIRVASGLLVDAAHVRFEIRVGDAAGVLRDATRELDVDLVVLAWHRDLSLGHGRLVREMLERGSIPIALFALDDQELTDVRVSS